MNLAKPLSAVIKQGRRIEHVANAGAAGLKGSRQVGGSALKASNKANLTGLNARKGWQRGSMQRQGVVGAEAHGAGSRVASATAHVSRNRKAYVVGGGAVTGGAVGGAAGGAYEKRKKGY